MMYMVRGNRGGAETDGRAEDPFEAAARGASASAPWKLLFFFFYLTLYPFLPPSLPLPLSYPPYPVPHFSWIELRFYGYAIKLEEVEERPQSLPWRQLSNTV